MPKAELHVHLEGTMTPQTHRRIAERNGVAVEGDVGDAHRCADFQSFLRAFLGAVKAIKKPIDLGEIAHEYLDRAADEGIRHIEFLFSPATLRMFSPDLDLEESVRAIFAEFECGRVQHKISSSLVFDVVRNLGLDAALADIALAQRCREFGVVGVGLGGDEANFPTRAFAHAFEVARKAGLRRTAHAGEAAGEESIVDAVLVLDAERIGHAVAARGKPAVLKLLCDRGVAVDACLTSNSATGALPRGELHPLKEFLDAGITVTLNSDDPAFFGSSLLDEYERAAQLGLQKSDLAALASNSFKAAFVADEQKKVWLGELEGYLAPT